MSQITQTDRETHTHTWEQIQWKIKDNNFFTYKVKQNMTKLMN